MAVSVKSPAPAKQTKRKKRKSAYHQGLEIKGARRRAEAMEYRIQGYTLHQIGEAMGISHVRAYQLIKQALAEVKSENVVELRNIVGHRLELITQANMGHAAKGDLNAGKMMLGVISEQAKIFGLYAPERKELTGKDGQPLEPTVIVTPESARSTLFEALAKAGVTGAVEKSDGEPEPGGSESTNH
jgi:hypothetical protein